MTDAGGGPRRSRPVAITVACLLPVVAVLLLTGTVQRVPVAQAWGPAMAPVTISQGVVTVSIHAKRRLTLGEVVGARPCLRLRHDSGTATTLCVRAPDRVRVYQSARDPFWVPSQLGLVRPRWYSLTIRQADLMLSSGPATAEVRCRSDCVPGVQSIIVPALQIASCQAQRPWLRYSGPDGVGKTVAFTFDDGPGAATRATLRILRRESVPATFFLVGQMIDQFPHHLLRRMLASGHVLGNHTWSHAEMTGADIRQITRTDRAISRASGLRPCLFRAPYGVNPRSVVDLARSDGMTTVNWNVDPRDWTGADASAVARTTLREVRPGSIAVFHDGTSRRTLLAALPRIISALKQRGFRFLTLPELLQLPTTYRA